MILPQLAKRGEEIVRSPAAKRGECGEQLPVSHGATVVQVTPEALETVRVVKRLHRIDEAKPVLEFFRAHVGGAHDDLRLGEAVTDRPGLQSELLSPLKEGGVVKQ